MGQKNQLTNRLLLISIFLDNLTHGFSKVWKKSFDYACQVGCEITQLFLKKLSMVQKIGCICLGVVHKLRYALFTTFLPPTYQWLCFCYHFTKYLLDKICNSYILLTTHPPQWHNVICERPLRQLRLLFHPPLRFYLQISYSIL